MDAIITESDRIKKSKRNCYKYSYVLKSKYYELLCPFYDTFGKDNIHIIIFENYLKSPSKEGDKIQNFLGVKLHAFDENFSQTKVKAGGIPLRQVFNSLHYRYKAHLKKMGLYPLSAWLVGLNMKYGKPIPEIDSKEKMFLKDALLYDRNRLKEMLGLDKDPWDNN